MSDVIALAGNPNVGKSTVFNALTGMRQHTGNWPGKTVECARGSFCHRGKTYEFVDLPGCYSLLSHSEEEEVARDYLCFDAPDAVIVVCDATCIERNLDLALQIMETTPNVVLCVNLMDEAERRGIELDVDLLSRRLGIPVVTTSARSGRGLSDLLDAIAEACRRPRCAPPDGTAPGTMRYPAPIERALDAVAGPVSAMIGDRADTRWASLRLLERTAGFERAMLDRWGIAIGEHPDVREALDEAAEHLVREGYPLARLQDAIAEAFVLRAEVVCLGAVSQPPVGSDARDRKLDKLFTSKLTGFPIMLALLFAVFWITIAGANVPSEMLADALFRIQDRLVELAQGAGVPAAVWQPLILGVYRVLAWVVSVMLPPMAIFFPLFTILEDFGYLPRVAFNLDRAFQKCSACGKQALTMCMGFGCNAAGVTGCRIIDSPRERLIAIITNNLVPCNGRFPTIISVITMFLVGGATGLAGSLAAALGLLLVVVLGVCMTLLASKLLSKTILKGMPSSFTLELPPYRTPQVGKIIVRSVFDRTLLVLGRAVVVAAPAGLVIWVLANVQVADASILAHCTAFLDPFARVFGLDGVILMAFILGMPANEIVVPVMLMTYLSQGALLEIADANVMAELLISHGWTWVTAACVVLFSLMHWPCGTTCLTIKKEAGGLKWMLVSIAVPTLMGLASCFAFANGARLLGALFGWTV